MKSTILLLFFGIQSIVSYSQMNIDTDSLIRRIENIEYYSSKVGSGMNMFANKQIVGLGLFTFGTITTNIGISRNEKTLRSAGYAALGIGFMVWISSYSGLRIASKYIKGDRIVIPLNDKKSK